MTDEMKPLESESAPQVSNRPSVDMSNVEMDQPLLFIVWTSEFYRVPISILDAFCILNEI